MEAFKSKWDSAATDDEKEEALKPEVDPTTRVKQENEEDSDLRYAGKTPCNQINTCFVVTLAIY